VSPLLHILGGTDPSPFTPGIDRRATKQPTVIDTVGWWVGTAHGL